MLQTPQVCPLLATSSIFKAFTNECAILGSITVVRSEGSLTTL